MKGVATEEDKNIGNRLRILRKEMGVSQMELADVLGITFQQVQKYERGLNRISASRLFKFVRHYNLDMSAFDVKMMDDETSLFLNKYKSLDKDKQELLMDFIKTLSKKKK